MSTKGAVLELLKDAISQKKRLPNADWKIAIEHFDNAMEDKKLSRKLGKTNHTFIKTDDGLVMNESKEVFSRRGSFGKVKFCYKNEEEILFILKAIKIKIGDELNEKNTLREAAILKEMDKQKGMLVLPVPVEERLGKNEGVEKKIYIVQEYYPGVELFDLLYAVEERINLDSLQKYIIAIKCCEEVKKAHKYEYLHLDIKPENFIVDIDKDDPYKITVNLIDYGLAKKMQNKKVEKEKGVYEGTPGYMAPETYFETGFLSPKTDVFSLGVIFKNDLGLPKNLYENMLTWDQDSRKGLDEVISQIKDFSRVEPSKEVIIDSEENILGRFVQFFKEKYVALLTPEENKVDLFRLAKMLEEVLNEIEKIKNKEASSLAIRCQEIIRFLEQKLKYSTHLEMKGILELSSQVFSRKMQSLNIPIEVESKELTAVREIFEHYPAALQKNRDFFEATIMLLEGVIEEGESVVDALVDRIDMYRDNPECDTECVEILTKAVTALNPTYQGDLENNSAPSPMTLDDILEKAQSVIDAMIDLIEIHGEEIQYTQEEAKNIWMQSIEIEKNLEKGLKEEEGKRNQPSP